MHGRVVGLILGGVIFATAVPAVGRYAETDHPGGAAAEVAAPAAPAPVLAASVTVKTRTAASRAVFQRLAAVAHEKAGPSPHVLDLAVNAVSCAVTTGAIEPPRTLTVIDYSLASVEPRLWVFDVQSARLLFKELVAHGRNTGDNMATSFSDTPESRQSSIGLFVTRDTYVGSNGYSLRLDGLEPGFNGRARERAIVMHGAPYVNAALADSQGRIGRSWGCPALREAVAREVIDTIRGGGVIFSYYPDDNWLNSSRFLNCNSIVAA